MRLAFREWRQQIFLILFFGVIAMSLIGPIASITTLPDLADFVNHLAGIIQAKMALVEGQFPLRVAPAEQSGWRYPLFQFYSPTPYTIAGTIYWLLTPSNPLLAYKITVLTALTVAGVYMYRLAYWFVDSKPAALLAGVVYLSSPYYIIVVNRLGSLSETIALAIIPAIVYYTLQRFFNPTKYSTLLQVSLVWYLLMTTHLITFVYTSLLIGIFLVLLTAIHRQYCRNLMAVGIGYGLACLLGLWFLGPIAYLAKFFILSDTYSSAKHINFFHPLLSYLLSPSASIATDFNSALLKLHPGVGWPILLAAGFCIYAVFSKLKSGNTRSDTLLPFFVVLFALAFFMAWSPVDFWQWLPEPLLVAQYSWRLLNQVIWIGALLFAWSVMQIYKDKLNISHILIGAFLILMAGSQWIPNIKYAPIDYNDFVKNPHLIYNHNAYSINFSKFPQFVNQIDSMLIDPDHEVKLNSDYTLHTVVMNLTTTPAISVEGNIANTVKGNKQLVAMVDGKIVGTKALTAGKFFWHFPVTYPANHPTAVVRFALNPATDDKTIKMDRVLLTGFLKPDETLNVTQVQSHCLRKHATTICMMEVAPLVKLMELPILYYPKLLQVLVNGKEVPYFGVMYRGYLMTGIAPIAGTNNTVSIRFNGLVWANDVSLFAWLIWLGILASRFWQTAR